tara:strand:+ start:65 stop:334 length:270 start_codon:yes stop_codon:yes gene_type:complete
MEKDEVYSKENVAKRLKWLRETTGLTQSAFADSINVTPTVYNNWETGRQRLSLEGALSLNKVYGTTLDFLFLARRGDLPPELIKSLPNS